MATFFAKEVECKKNFSGLFKHTSLTAPAVGTAGAFQLITHFAFAAQSIVLSKMSGEDTAERSYSLQLKKRFIKRSL